MPIGKKLLEDTKHSRPCIKVKKQLIPRTNQVNFFASLWANLYLTTDCNELCSMRVCFRTGWEEPRRNVSFHSADAKRERSFHASFHTYLFIDSVRFQRFYVIVHIKFESLWHAENKLIEQIDFKELIALNETIPLPSIEPTILNQANKKSPKNGVD